MAVVISDEPDIALHMPWLEVAAAKAAVIIELGCGDGNGSLRALSRGFRRSSLAKLYVSVDLRTDRPRSDRPQEYWWYLVHGDTADPETLAKVAYVLDDEKADLVFIDTNHTYEHLSIELELWKPLVDPMGTWVFHDTWMGGVYNQMTDAIKEFAEREGFRFFDLFHESNGLGIMTRCF